MNDPREHELGRHEEELARLLAAAPDPRAALARSPLTSCPTCGELVSLAGRLEALGEEQRSAMGSALAGPAPATGEAERVLRATILEATRARAPELAAPPSSRRMTAFWFGAAAAALLAVLLWSKSRDSEGPDRDGTNPRLGSPLALLHPVGTVDDFAEFRWSPAGPEAGWYRIVVRPVGEAGEAAGGGGAAGAPTESERIFGTTWQPTPEERERWGDRIRWTLEVYRATGASDLVDSKSASAELSSR